MIRTGLLPLGALLVVGVGAANAQTPKAAYDELCLSCHKAPQRLAARIERTDAARAKLDEFLIKHYAPDAEKRAAVVEYVYSLK